MQRSVGQILREAAEVFYPIRDMLPGNISLIMGAREVVVKREELLKLILKREELDAQIIKLVGGTPEPLLSQAFQKDLVL